MHNSDTSARQLMGFGGILGITFNLYRKHFLLFLGIISLNFCGSLVEYLLTRFLPDFRLKDILTDFVGMPFALVSMGGIIIATATIYLSGHITSRDALKQTLHRFWHVLAAFLAWSLAFDISRIRISFTIFSVIDPIPVWTPGSSVTDGQLQSLQRSLFQFGSSALRFYTLTYGYGKRNLMLKCR